MRSPSSMVAAAGSPAYASSIPIAVNVVTPASSCFDKLIGTGGSTRYSYRDHVEIKPGLVHSQTYTAYAGSVMNEVRHFIENCIGRGEQPLSTMADAITAQKMIEACEKSIREGSVVSL